MAFDFEKLKDDIVSAGKDVGAMAKDATNTAKLKMDIRSKEDFLNKQYAELGKAFYKAHKDDTEDFPEKEFFASIKEASDAVEALTDSLLNMQGAVVCPDCGKKQPKDGLFCNNCGAKLFE